MDTPAQVLEKLQKLLRLGTSSNIHEAELAMQRAQEIATKYKISLSAVSMDEQAPEKFERTQTNRERRTFHQHFVDWIVQRHFNVKLVYSGRIVWYIGKPSDTSFAQFVSDYLAAEFPRQFQFYCQQPGAVYDRHTFFYGMFKGLDAKLTEARIATENREFSGNQGARSKYELMVVQDAEGLKRALVQFFPRLRNSRSNVMNRDAGCYGAGVTAGRAVNISRPIGGGRAGALRLK